MKRLLFVFLDGVGLGPDEPHNPFSALSTDAFYRLAGDQAWTRPFSDRTDPRHQVTALDATLGIEGLPQSGTGQASLLTGHNCADIVGRHFGPYPHSQTHEVLDHDNLFQQVDSLPDGSSPAFANAFPPQYFEAERRRATVTTYCCQAAGLPLRDIQALRDGRALSADLTGSAWRNQLSLSVPRRDEPEAATTLAEITRSHSLTFFEYFLTDKVGHERSDIPPHTLLSQLDAFFDTLLHTLDPAQETLLVTSDHGNLENTSHTQHTRNPVPLIVMGWAAPYFADATSLTDVTPSIVEALQNRLPE